MKILLMNFYKRNIMKTLHRSNKSKILGGVCGGVGEYLDTDPNIIRIVLVILLALGIFTIFWPLFCFVVYIAAWILLPEQPEGARSTESSTS